MNECVYFANSACLTGPTASCKPPMCCHAGVAFRLHSVRAEFNEVELDLVRVDSGVLSDSLSI